MSNRSGALSEAWHVVLYTLSQGIRTSESLLPRMWHFVSGFGLGVMRFCPQCSLSSLAARSRHQVFVAHGRLHRLLSRSSGSRTGWNAWRAVRRLLAAKFRVSSNWSDSNPEPIGSPDLQPRTLSPSKNGDRPAQDAKRSRVLSSALLGRLAARGKRWQGLLSERWEALKP